MSVHPSGFYAWLKQPLSQRAIEDKRLLGQVKQFWMESGFIYGYRNTKQEMRHVPTCLIISSFSTTQLGVMATMMAYHRLSLKNSIMRHYKVSIELGACHAASIVILDNICVSALRSCSVFMETVNIIIYR